MEFIFPQDTIHYEGLWLSYKEIIQLRKNSPKQQTNKQTASPLKILDYITNNKHYKTDYRWVHKQYKQWKPCIIVYLFIWDGSILWCSSCILYNDRILKRRKSTGFIGLIAYYLEKSLWELNLTCSITHLRIKPNLPVMHFQFIIEN